MTALENIKVVTEACRQGLQSLANQPSSNFKGFPNGSCGLSADIVGRILYERLGVEGMYVDAKKKPKTQEKKQQILSGEKKKRGKVLKACMSMQKNTQG